MIVYFNTPRPIPIEALITFGVSVKETDSPIGRFGTGFKYALAVILRAGGEVRVVSGDERFEFDTAVSEIRGRRFDIVRMNGQPLSFTTELGKDWEMWQAYRELHSNTLDEGGSVDTQPRGDFFIEVVCSEFYTAFCNRKEVFLESEPLERTPVLSIHPGRSNFLYYRGVRVAELPKTSRFTYNILNELDLTEDRTVKSFYMAIYYINRGIVHLENKKLILDIVDPRNAFESESINYDNPTETFIEAISDGTERGVPICIAAIKAVSAVAKRSIDEVELDDFNTTMLKRCVEKLYAIGYEVDGFPIKISKTMFGQCWGSAVDGTIWLAKELFDQGEHEVMTTLLEEWMHLRYGYEDGTRAMMNWAFTQIIAQGMRRLG